MFRAFYARVPATCRMMIGQFRRGRFGALRGDDPDLARAVWKDRGEDWARMYWNDTDAPQRQVMLEAVDNVAPFGSLLELGCNSGPNLRLIRERFPDAELRGIEFSEDAVRVGCDQGFDIRQGSFDRIGECHDVILSMWSLCCSPPSEIEKVIDGMVRSARRSIVIIEPDCHGQSVLRTPLPTWRHDYAGFLTRAHMRVEFHPTGLDEIQRVIIARH